MKRNRGFTLIELLSVIILLGVIIAIIVPKISTTIETSKQKAAADNGLVYIKATRDYYNANILNNDFILKDGKNYVKDIDSYIEINGERPLSGYLTIANNKIVYAKMCINYYEVTYQNNDASVTGKCDGVDEE